MRARTVSPADPRGPWWPDALAWRSAWRAVRRQPLVSIAIVVALATGIALSTAGFAFVSAALWSELPFAGGERFVRLRAFSPEGERGEVEPDRYRFLRERARQLEYLGTAASGRLAVLRPDGEVEPVVGAVLTPGWFAYLPTAPLLGRLPGPADGEVGAPPVAVVRESFWRRRLGGDPAAIGTTLRIGITDYTVVGVVPDTLAFPNRGEIWAAAPELAPREGAARVAAVLARGATVQGAAAEVDRLSALFDADRGATRPSRITLRGLTDVSGSGIDVAVSLLQGLLLLVLLLVAGSVGNLVVARAEARSGELSLRAALGATRFQLARQLLLEIALLGLVAGACGFATAQGLLRLLRDAMGEDLPFWFDLGPRPGTALFVALVTLLGVAVAGVLPALRATRGATAVGLDGSRSSARLGRASSFWIVAEMAVAVALVASAVAIARGGALSMQGGAGLPRARLATAQISFESAVHGRSATPPEQALTAVRVLPGVVAAGLATSLPTLSAATERIEIEPLTGEAPLPARRAPTVAVTAGFLEALTERATAGRLIDTPDLASGAAPVAVVNQSFVAQHLGGRSPVGRRLRVVDAREPQPWREIVGVVPDLGLGAGDPGLAGGVYVPLRGEPSLVYLAARTAGDAARFVAPVRRALFALDPELAVERVLPLESVAAEDRRGMAGIATALGFVGAITLLLAALGIYATVSFRVARRTREIGVRVALGATAADVLRLVVGRVGALFALGAVGGSLAAWGLLAVRAAVFVARFPGPGPWVVPAVSLALGATGLAACWGPVRRALAIEPARALGSE